LKRLPNKNGQVDLIEISKNHPQKPRTRFL
jgi:hypothetical protein